MGKIQIDWETALEGLNEYEEAMLNEVVSPAEIDVGFDGEFCFFFLPLIYRHLRSVCFLKNERMLNGFSTEYQCVLDHSSDRPNPQPSLGWIQQSRPFEKQSSTLSSIRISILQLDHLFSKRQRECCSMDHQVAEKRCWQRLWPERVELRL